MRPSPLPTYQALQLLGGTAHFGLLTFEELLHLIGTDFGHEQRHVASEERLGLALVLDRVLEANDTLAEDVEHRAQRLERLLLHPLAQRFGLTVLEQVENQHKELALVARRCRIDPARHFGP